jgi:hypothetical protein
MISNESYIFLAAFAALALVALIYLLSTKMSILVEDITTRGAEFRERVNELLRRHAYPRNANTRFALDSRQPTLEYRCVGHFHVNPYGCRS